MYDIIILGSGPAGLTAAIYAVRAGYKTLVIAGVRWGGQLMLTTLVENFPGFPEGIEGPKLMLNMRKQAERLGAKILNVDFTQADFSSFPFKIIAGERVYESKVVIIATGTDSLWLNAPGEKELRGRGISVCATCDAFFFRNKDVMVIGGGDSAMEEALVLAKVARSVTIVHRREEFRASKAMQEKVFSVPKIKIIWNGELVEYHGKEKLEAVTLKLKPQNGKLKFQIQNQNLVVSLEEFKKRLMQQWSKEGKVLKITDEELLWQLPIDGVFLAIGHKPNTEKFKGIEIDSKGYIVRKEVQEENGLLKYRFATSVAGVFVAGDVHDYRYRQAITAAGFGCMAALDADRWLQESSFNKTTE